MPGPGRSHAPFASSAGQPSMHKVVGRPIVTIFHDFDMDPDCPISDAEVQPISPVRLDVRNPVSARRRPVAAGTLPCGWHLLEPSPRRPAAFAAAILVAAVLQLGGTPARAALLDPE